MGSRETKRYLIEAIRKAQRNSAFGPASVEYLRTRTVAQLRETLGRVNAIDSVTPAEAARHCNVSFIK